MKHRLRALGLVATLTLPLLTASPSPSAAEAGRADEVPAGTVDVADTVGAVADVVGDASRDDVDDAAGVQASVDGASLEVPVDSAAGATVTPNGGQTIGLGLPDTAEPVGTQVGGEVVFNTSSPAADLAIRPTAQGVQALIAIAGAEAPMSYAFPVTVEGAPARLADGPEGTVNVFTATSSEVAAVIQPAWAIDASGQPVPTHFRIDGGNLVQVVDHHQAAYPVVADPSIGLGKKIYVKYGKSEVKRIAANAVTKKIKYSAAICAGIPIAIAAAACGFYVYDSFASISSTFESAARNKRCVEMSYLWNGYLVGWKSYGC